MRWIYMFAVVGMSAEFVACSGAPDTGNSKSSTPSGKDDHPTLLPSSTETVDFSYAIAVPMKPETSCKAHPEGIANDAVRFDYLTAGKDGEVRFYPPAKEWGTRVTLNCTLDGVDQGEYLVDVNDPSTFKREDKEQLVPTVIGVRPALTGDLSALSVNDFIGKGYMPPPDPVLQPEAYAMWKDGVTKPVNIYNAILTARLGERAGAFEGTGNSNWSGIVQSANGFQILNNQIVTASTNTLYEEYFATLNSPSSSCAANPTGGCNTALWAGIGGFQFPFFGSPATPQLIQSGFNPLGSNPAAPFIEYTPGGIVPVSVPPPGFAYAAGDAFQEIGWSATSSSCGAISTTGQWACFEFYDATRGWIIEPAAIRISSGPFMPVTTEYVTEWVSHDNAKFSTQAMTGGGYDFNNNFHADPGSGSDPYIVSTQNGSSGPVATATWNNGSVNSPQDPMIFTWKNPQ
jgi:hypothetical protein